MSLNGLKLEMSLSLNGTNPEMGVFLNGKDGRVFEWKQDMCVIEQIRKLQRVPYFSGTVN